jgi:uncharacterized protein
MKKLFAAVLLCLCMTLVFVPSALAANSGYLYDDAGLLTQEQLDDLAQRSSEISDKYQCTVAIQTVTALSSDSAYDEAEKCFQSGMMGRGDANDGILLYFADDADNHYAVYSSGLGAEVLTDENYNDMCDNGITPAFQKSGAYAAFSAYLDKADEYLAAAGKTGSASGSTAATAPAAASSTAPAATASTAPAADTGRDKNSAVKALLVFGAPLAAALIVCLILKSKMQTAVAATQADDYFNEDAFVVTNREDLFLYRTEKRVHHERKKSD